MPRLATVMLTAEWGWNIVGYAGWTVSIATGRALRNERRADMAKKRSCRRTTDESIIHDKAVKMRKMTDEQLVHYVEDRVEKARSEGFNQGKAQTPKFKSVSIEKIVKEIGNVRGIGITKLGDIRRILERHLGVWTHA